MGQSEGIHEILHNLWGRGFAGSMLSATTLAAVVFLPPTLAMGATFTQLAQKAGAEGNGFGGALCINTFGASLAPFVFGVLLLPLLGPKVTLVSVSAGYLALISLSAQQHYKPLFVPLFAGAILLMSPYSLDLVTLEPGM
jgi:spermidine synthase